jgi:hypothetical protein
MSEGEYIEPGHEEFEDEVSFDPLLMLILTDQSIERRFCERCTRFSCLSDFKYRERR